MPHVLLVMPHANCAITPVSVPYTCVYCFFNVCKFESPGAPEIFDYLRTSYTHKSMPAYGMMPMMFGT